MTDNQGNVWDITDDGSIQENGEWTPGGGGTQALTIVNGVVYAEGIGNQGWFTLSSDQTWTPAAPPVTATVSAAQSVQSTTPPTVAAAPPQTQSCPTEGTASGTFQVASGQIIGPNGQSWIARGLNMADSNMGDAPAVISLFPGVNFVRLAVYSYQDPGVYAAFINTMTAHGTVVEIEHHVETNGSVSGGGQGGIATGLWLAQESAFYASMAKAYAANPYVWWGTTNEPPSGSGLSAWHQATYNAIRGAGNNNPILIELPGGGDPGFNVNTYGLNPSVYATMTNIGVDAHFYGWASSFSADPNAISAALTSLISGAQTIIGASGPAPVIIGEYGPSTNGVSPDPNGDATAQAVITAGANGQAGSAAWHWGQEDCCNNLNTGATPTDPFGQEVQLFINTDVIPPNQCQLAAVAQQGIASASPPSP